MLGLTDASVWEWKHHDQLPSIENLLKIAQLGNTSIEWLLTGMTPAEPDRREGSVVLRLGETMLAKIAGLARSEGKPVDEEIAELIADGMLAREIASNIGSLMRTKVARSETESADQSYSNPLIEPSTMLYDLPGNEEIHSSVNKDQSGSRKKKGTKT